ncbi:MAG TPA: GntR family transcriptional regulator [Solirubrobacterales bacterium]|jgi:GntR family transcriptional regulator
MAKPTQPVRGRPRQSSDVPLAGSRKLDRDSEVPLYFQLAAELHRMLELGTWEPGARFATERELEEEFEVSRAVIRPALDLLVGDGTIFRVKGSGAFVAAPRAQVEATGLVKLWASGDRDHSVSVASVRKRTPDRTVSQFLELGESRAEIAQVTAVVDIGEPSAFVVDSYSSISRLPWLLPTADAFANGANPPRPGKLELTRSTVLVEHTFLSGWSASQVGSTAGSPALIGRFVQFGRTNGAKQERPLEFARLIWRTDTTQLAFELE